MPKKGFKYPKFMLLVLTFLLAYGLFKGREYPYIHDSLASMGYFGTFLAGVFFVFGFTSAISTAVFLIIAKEQSLIPAGLIAGLGAMVGDIVIFRFIRLSFADEIELLSKEKVVQYLNGNIPSQIRRLFLPVFAGIIIASPLPDEIGVTMLAACKEISLDTFSVLSYILNTTGIFIILLIGKAI